MELKEDLLYHIWKFRLYELPLRDLDEHDVEIMDPGLENRDAGPDFFNAKIRWGNILWAGNVEIHRRASEWYQHGHHEDPLFDNVILHVVLDPDCQVRNSKGRLIHTARMGIRSALRLKYEMLMESPDFIPCWREVGSVDPNGMNIWLERLLVERMEQRTLKIGEELKNCDNDWNEVLYRTLARAFGQRVNAEPFEMLARSAPLRILPGTGRNYTGRKLTGRGQAGMDRRERDQLVREAILFGQAGMLDRQGYPVGPRSGSNSGSRAVTRPGASAGTYTGVPEDTDPYFTELVSIYSGIRGKLRPDPIDGYLWKFLRLRPDNFPTIRISQLACSLGRNPDLFGRLVDEPDPMAFVMGMDIKASDYWTCHYRFGRPSPEREKRMGENRLRGLYINAFLPVLYAYYRKIRKPGKAEILAGEAGKIPAEDNRVIRMWKSLGVMVPDALYTQSLLQLTNNYCKFKRCLSCYVGSQIIKSFSTQK